MTITGLQRLKARLRASAAKGWRTRRAGLGSPRKRGPRIIGEGAIDMASQAALTCLSLAMRAAMPHQKQHAACIAAGHLARLSLLTGERWLALADRLGLDNRHVAALKLATGRSRRKLTDIGFDDGGQPPDEEITLC